MKSGHSFLRSTYTDAVLFRWFPCEKLKLLKGKQEQKVWTTSHIYTKQLTQTGGKGTDGCEFSRLGSVRWQQILAVT